MTDSDRLDEVASALYATPPSAFTAARNARAAEAGGDLGRRIARLRKPTAAAWAVNLLVRDGQLAEAVQLSAALHEAHDDLDVDELSRLGRQRRQLVAALARRASDLAAEAGAPLSAAMTDAVQKTVNAAIVDDTVAAAVLTGRLVTAVDLAGLDAEALSTAVAGSHPAEVPAPAPRDDLAARTARRAAERAVREAERLRADADRDAAAAERRLAQGRERADRAHERVDALRAELSRAASDADAADVDLEARESAHTTAREAVRRAAEAVAHARAAYDEGAPG